MLSTDFEIRCLSCQSEMRGNIINTDNANWDKYGKFSCNEFFTVELRVLTTIGWIAFGRIDFKLIITCNLCHKNYIINGGSELVFKSIQKEGFLSCCKKNLYFRFIMYGILHSLLFSLSRLLDYHF